jgi:hypothetical protein
MMVRISRLTETQSKHTGRRNGAKKQDGHRPMWVQIHATPEQTLFGRPICVIKAPIESVKNIRTKRSTSTYETFTA